MTVTPSTLFAELLPVLPLFAAGAALATWIHTTGGCQ